MSAPRARVGRLGLRLWLRHRRRMLFFSACLAAGTAFLFSIGSLLAALEGGIAAKARELMAADASVSSERDFDAKAEAAFARLAAEGARETRTLLFYAMLAPSGSGEPPFLVNVKAVEPAYPLYGKLETEPAAARTALAQDGACLLDGSAPLQHGLRAGDMVRIGRAELKVAGFIKKEPDRSVFSAGLAPRVMVSIKTAEASGLLRLGSRITRTELLALPPSPAPEAAARALKSRLERELDDAYLHVGAYPDAEPSLRELLRRVSLFFVLVSLAALLLGAVGMAAGVALFLDEQVETAGVLRCLGAGAADVARLYNGLCLTIGLQGAALGVLAGWALSAAALGAVQRLLGLELASRVPLSWPRLAEAAGLACAVSVGVNYAKVGRLARLSPLEALREPARRAEPGPWASAATLAAGLLLVFAYTWMKVQSLRTALLFSIALVGSSAAAWLLARAALRATGAAARLFAGPRGFSLRHGLRQLVRHRSRSMVFLFTLGSGFSLLIAIGIVHHSIARGILLGKAEDLPDLFLIDVQKSQAAGVEKLASRWAQAPPDFAPLVRARLLSVNGQALRRQELEGLDLEERSRYRFLAREHNLTYKDRMQASETLTAGRWWAAGESVPQASVEKGFLQSTGLKLGDRLAFDVQGRTIEVPITSARSVEWTSMQPNFFVVLPTKVLENAPQTLIASLRVRDDAKAAAFQKDLLKAFPNVSVINISRVLDNVQALLGVLLKALAAVAWFSVGVGLLVLGGTLALGGRERAAQTALLKALGLDRRRIIAVDAAELSAVGLLTFAIAGLVSFGLAKTLAWQLDVEFSADPLWVLRTLILAAVLPAAVGLAVNWPAYGAAVMDTLRKEA